MSNVTQLVEKIIQIGIFGNLPKFETKPKAVLTN